MSGNAPITTATSQKGLTLGQIRVLGLFVPVALLAGLDEVDPSQVVPT